MTMFTRNDKPSDQAADNKGPDSKGTERPASAPEAAPMRSNPPAHAAAPKNASAESATSVISKALRITGQLESSEAIRIDGTVEGDVRGQSVTVGSGATVTGTVAGETVELAGTVNGKIEARMVVLKEGARMSGDVIHQDIRIESGAYIDGNCRPSYGKTQDTKLHSLSPAASTLVEMDAAKKPANGGVKAGFGTL